MDTVEWPPFFHMPVLMLMLITLLNDGTLITIGYDYASPPKTLPVWNMRFLFSMAFVQAFVAMISSVNLLYVLLHSWDEGSLMKTLGLGGISFGEITSSFFRKVSMSVLSDVFSDARSRSFLVPRDDDRGGSRRAQWVFPDPHVRVPARRMRSWANPRPLVFEFNACACT